jgi:hypothetical protein
MTTITERALLEQAVEELLPVSHNSTDDPRGQADKAIALLRAALAAKPSAPAWHDAPNKPGDWVFCRRGAVPYFYKVHCTEDWIDSDGRWCGPLPEDKP